MVWADPDCSQGCTHTAHPVSVCPLASPSFRIFSSFAHMVSHSECPNEEGLLSGGLAVWHWHVPWHENTTNAVIILCT